MNIKSLVSKFTIYQYMIIFLEVLVLVSAFFYGFGAKALLPVLIAVFTTTILDSAISYYKTKQWEFPQSAFISGLFIGGLLVQGLRWYIYPIAGIIAILSKHLIKIKGKHIFNPANIGVLAVSVFFGVSHNWWISSPLVLVLLFGIFIIWRLRRFDLTLSFLFSYYLVNSVIELSKGVQYSDIYLTIFNGSICFFSMFMLIEPKTNPSGKKQRIAYGILVALFLIVLHIKIPKHDLPLALAIGNIFVPILNRISFDFKKKDEAQPNQT